MLLKALLSILVIGLVGLGVALYAVSHHPPEPVAVQQEIKDVGADYSIGVKYPYVSGVNHEADANNAVWQFVQQQMAAFKGEVAHQNPSRQAVDHKSALYTEYTVTVLNPEIITVRFKISSYFTVDSHPQTSVLIFSYDLENNQSLQVKTGTL